jgi:hypothetical protein
LGELVLNLRSFTWGLVQSFHLSGPVLIFKAFKRTRNNLHAKRLKVKLLRLKQKLGF